MKKKIAIIGGGAAALSVASFLDADQFEIHLFEKNKALGRKFLVAGKGGFNLTHGEGIEKMIARYTPNNFLAAALKSFTNNDFRIWLASIGIPTFVGSSNRVYPEKGIKPIEVLRGIENALALNHVKVHYNKTWVGWQSKNELSFEDGEQFETDYTIFALGGASWKVTGSDGSWKTVFEEKEIKTNTFIPSNCAYKIAWPEKLKTKFSGTPLKNISISCGNQTQKGEAVLTETGLEGNAIYALSPNIREQLRNGSAAITIDFKPQQNVKEIEKKLSQSKLKNVTDRLKVNLRLSPVQVALLKEFTSKEIFLNLQQLAQTIKSTPINIIDIATIDEAISTVGGINLNELNERFELKQIPNAYCIGEMLDWDAPTGGYLLQSCFSMGYYLAKQLNKK